MGYIKILESTDSEAVEVPLEKDGTLLLSTLVGQYPGTTGIRFKSEKGSWRGVKCEGNVIHPPIHGWGNNAYYIVKDDGSGEGCVKRSVGDGDGPAKKAPKLDERDLIGHSLHKQLGQLEKAIHAKYLAAHGADALNVNDSRPVNSHVFPGLKPDKPGGGKPSNNNLPNIPFPLGVNFIGVDFQRCDDGKVTFTAEDGREWKLWPKQIEALRRKKQRLEEEAAAIARGETPGTREVPCEPIKPGQRGLHVLSKQGLVRLLGRHKIGEEAIQLFRRYLYLVTPGQSARLERKSLQGGEDTTWIFIETDMKDPSQLSDAIYRDLYSGNCGQNILEVIKCWVKFLPVHATCTTEYEEIQKAVIGVIDPIFQEHARIGKKPEFKIQVSGDNKLYNGLKNRLLTEYLASKGCGPDECWNDDSENCIFLKFKDKQNMCFVSFLKNYNKFDKYSLFELSKKLSK